MLQSALACPGRIAGFSSRRMIFSNNREINIMKIYLSGPMTGLPKYNYPEFNRVADILRKMEGVSFVYNPAYEWGSERDFDARKAFADYCRFICKEADAIYMLRGWSCSKGATCERDLAKICNIRILEQGKPFEVFESPEEFSK